MFHTYRKVLGAGGLVFCLFSSVFAYSGGSGTEADPYRIANANDLLELAADTNDYNDCFILINNINLADYDFTTAVIARDTDSANLSFNGSPFMGIFDGAGYEILNLTIDTNGVANDYLGLFGKIDHGEIKNLGLQNVNIRGIDGNNPYLNNFNYLGGLAGETTSGNISNCYSTGSIFSGNGTYSSGGLIGAYSGYITNCFSTCSVTTSVGNGIGGLVGTGGGVINSSGVINNCFATGNITGGNDSSWLGGLAGGNGGVINNCFATGNVTGGNDSYVLGGLVGGNKGDISNCYSTGDVNGQNNIGGLAGIHDHGSVSNCYSIGNLTGINNLGGLAGFAQAAAVFVSNFWDINSSGLTDGVGSIEPDPNGVTGKTTAEMQDINTFTSAGWDFDYTDGDKADWFMQIDEYPILTWQISPADIYTDGRNNFRDFTIFAQYWMREDCAIYNYYCDWADLDFSGSVDIDDLIILMSYWLQSGIYN